MQIHDWGPRSHSSTEGEFINNLFGVDVGTPESVAAYLRSMYHRAVPSFHQKQSNHQQEADTSSAHYVDDYNYSSVTRSTNC